MEGGLKTIVIHIPKRCRKAKMDIFDDHIDNVNNARSKKYLPEDTNIIVMGMGGQGLIDNYNKKYFNIPIPNRTPTPTTNIVVKKLAVKKKAVKKKATRKKVVKKIIPPGMKVAKKTKKAVNKTKLKKAIDKQKKFLDGDAGKDFW
tara:strand:+ start:2889 stop:3326 length:438 start_codon:yes stop_codon:yes gene_type:complete